MQNGFYRVLKASLPKDHADLFIEAGLTHLSDPEKDQLLDQFVITLQKRMAAKTWAIVKPDKRNQLMDLAKINPAKAQLELIKTVPDYLSIYHDETLNLRQEFIKQMKGQL